METHRYVRPQLFEGNQVDHYNLHIDSFGKHSSKTVEYWTNGTTTLLGVPPVNKRDKGTISKAVTPSVVTRSNNKANTMGSTTRSKISKTAGSRDGNSVNVIRNSLLAGSVAGMTSTIVCHPFDVLRVKMQSTAPMAATTATGTTTATATAATNMGLIGTIRHTVTYGGGLRGLYTGLTLPLAAQAVYKATVFTVNNMMEKATVEWKTQENHKLGNFQTHKLSLTDRFWCGFIGGAVNAALFVTPVEFVRNQQIAEHSQLADSAASSSRSARSAGSIFLNRSGPFSVIQSTIQSNGVGGLWRGLSSTILRDSVGCGCFFVAMAYTQQHLVELRDETSPSLSTLMASGAAAGLAYWVWGLPVDTVKTWIQSGKANDLRHAIQQLSSSPSSSPRYLFQGWQVAYSRGLPSAAITVMTYSLSYQYLSDTL